MIHLNLSADLEKALRDMSAKSGYPITTICTALMHIGIKSPVKDIDEACTNHARPMGRPQVTSVPTLAGPAKVAGIVPTANKMTTDEFMRKNHWGKYAPKYDKKGKR